MATSLVEGPIFEIVTSLTEVQNATEKQLFRERLQILRGQSQEKFDFQAKYQEKICDVSNPDDVMKVTQSLEDERKDMESNHTKVLKEFDQNIVLKLDQQLKDQTHEQSERIASIEQMLLARTSLPAPHTVMR